MVTNASRITLIVMSYKTNLLLTVSGKVIQTHIGLLNSFTQKWCQAQELLCWQFISKRNHKLLPVNCSFNKIKIEFWEKTRNCHLLKINDHKDTDTDFSWAVPFSFHLNTLQYRLNYPPNSQNNDMKIWMKSNRKILH